MRFQFLTLSLFCLSFATLPLAAQNAIGIDEPDPFRVLGKLGDQAADASGNKPMSGGAQEDDAPTPLDAQISQHIMKLAEAERDHRMSFMKIVIDDIARLCELDEVQRDRLELAAKGASERSMKEWHEQAERYFRTRLESADPDAAKEMLEGMGNVNFGGNRSEEEGESLDLWKESLKDVLTKEQIEGYEAVLKQRRHDRIEAFTGMSVSTINDHLRLTPEQKEKVTAIVRASATEYLDDVQRYWGDYFERGMLMSLVNAVDGETLKEFLSEKQYERLREATSNFDHFWDQKRRLKSAKAKAAARSKKGKEEADKEVNDEKEKAPHGAVRIQGGGIRVKVQ